MKYAQKVTITIHSKFIIREFIFLKERGAKTNEERRGYGFWEKLLRSTKKKERVKASHAIVKKYCTYNSFSFNPITHKIDTSTSKKKTNLSL